MNSFNHIRFANEDDEYRLPDDALLEKEPALRQKIEHVASLQRQLIFETLLRFKVSTPSFI